jgi:Na+/melibiose symporter-like transporter
MKRISYASAVKRESFKTDVKTLLKNKDYIYIFLSMTLIFGEFSVIYVFLPWITKTYNYETVSNGLIIICANIAGCVGCAVVSVLKRHLTYKKICTIGLIGLCLNIGLLWLSF